MTKYLLRYLAVLAGVALAAGLLLPGNATAQPDPYGTQGARPAAAPVGAPASSSVSSGAITSTATAAPNACTEPPGCCPAAAQIAPQSAIPQTGPSCEPPSAIPDCQMTPVGPIPDYGDVIAGGADVTCTAKTPAPARFSMVVDLEKRFNTP